MNIRPRYFCMLLGILLFSGQLPAQETPQLPADPGLWVNSRPLSLDQGNRMIFRLGSCIV